MRDVIYRKVSVCVAIAIASSWCVSADARKKKCGWRYPGACAKKVADVAVVVTAPATVIVDVAGGKPIGSTAGKIVDEGVKVGDNTVKEVGRAPQNIGRAGLAIGHYIEHQVRGYKDASSDALLRVREGKFADAMWHAAIDPLKNQESGAAKAVQESSILNTVASTAAAAYGGPGGSAAYAAWYAYRASGGNAELALRVGVLAGSTSAGMNFASGLPSGTLEQTAQKAVVTGAIGGLAVAAAGGDEEAITKGFILAGGMVLVQDGYRSELGGELDARAAEGEPYCMAAVGKTCSPRLDAYILDDKGHVQFDDKGNPLVDIRKTDFRRPHVGTWSKSADGPLIGGTEASGTMQAVAKIPGMNAMSVFHDHWAVSWDMGSFTTVASIPPAVVITYVGTGAPYTNGLVDVAVDPDKKPAH